MPTLTTSNKIVHRLRLWVLAQLRQVAPLVISFHFTLINIDALLLIGEGLVFFDDVEDCFTLQGVLLLEYIKFMALLFDDLAEALVFDAEFLLALMIYFRFVTVFHQCSLRCILRFGAV